MALARVNRHQQTSGNAFGAGAFTTTSFTPSDNTLLVCRISAVSQADDGLTANDLTITGGGLTWTSRVSQTGPTGWAYAERVWTAPVSTGASMTIGADAGAFAIENYRVEVYEYSDYNTGSPVGGIAVGTDADGNDAASITLSATPATTSEVLAFSTVVLNGAAGTFTTEGSGWTELFDTSRDGWWCFESQVRGSSTSTDVSWADLNTLDTLATGAAMVALEIKEADGGPDPNASMGRLSNQRIRPRAFAPGVQR